MAFDDCVSAKLSVKQEVMCTLALYFQCFAQYPMVAVANRDEHFDRPSAAPSQLQTSPKIIAGKDLRAGGTWLGVNEFGLMAGILNRRTNGNAFPATVARSRGLLCWDLLNCQSATAARTFVEAHERRYNPFTVVFADLKEAYVSYNDDVKIITRPLEPGLHVFSSAAQLDLRSAKADRAHLRFAQLVANSGLSAAHPHQWLPELRNLLADHSLREGSDDPGDAICVHREASGTVSSSVIFFSQARGQFETFHSAGAPCQNSFNDAITLRVR